MLVKTVKVSDKGQISIPVDIRVLAGIHQGDDLIIIQEGEKIMLGKATTIAQQTKKEFSDLLKHSEHVAKKLWGSKEDDIWDTV